LTNVGSTEYVVCGHCTLFTAYFIPPTDIRTLACMNQYEICEKGSNVGNIRVGLLLFLLYPLINLLIESKRCFISINLFNIAGTPA